jgi:hypothetical protein
MPPPEGEGGTIIELAILMNSGLLMRPVMTAVRPETVSAGGGGGAIIVPIGALIVLLTNW